MARLTKTLTITHDLSTTSLFIDINKEMDDLMTNGLGATNYKLGKFKELNIQVNFTSLAGTGGADLLEIERSSIYSATGVGYGVVPDGTKILTNSLPSQDFNIGARFNVSDYYGIQYTKVASVTGTLTTVTIVLNT
jgi:hypothetical protein